MEIAQTNYRSCALAQSTRRAGLLMTHVALRREEAVDVVAVRVGVTGKRTLGQGLQSLAGAIGVALLFPVAILIIGLPIALAVRLVVDAVAWLTALTRS